ncbi:MAG: HAD family hydrolase [Nanoarchaeota archaeon]|nr:HAD family hydrolase [Nanoarchaeota archaeon]
MIKAIILDVDDTIIDFSKIASKLYQETALELGLNKAPIKKISRYFGTPHSKMLKEIWNYNNEKKFENIIFKKINRKKFKAFSGALKIIKLLHKKYTLALLSSKNKKIMNPQLKQINLSTSLFKFIYSKQDTRYNKPDPRVFSKPIKILKLKPQEILYVGDSIFDCKAAIKAKINFVAVLTGHYTRDEFKKYKIKNNNILKSLKQLPKWLEKNE